MCISYIFTEFISGIDHSPKMLMLNRTSLTWELSDSCKRCRSTVKTHQKIILANSSAKFHTKTAEKGSEGRAQGLTSKLLAMSRQQLHQRHGAAPGEQGQQHPRLLLNKEQLYKDPEYMGERRKRWRPNPCTICLFPPSILLTQNQSCRVPHHRLVPLTGMSSNARGLVHL